MIPALAVTLLERFTALHQQRPRIVRAPGRVNLIGEHTDYNDGLVMPAAIDRACYVAVAPRDDRRLVVHSLDVDDGFVLDADADQALPFSNPAHRWRYYVAGVALLLRAEGVDRGASLLIRSEVPQGAGLSSSAALETSVATALLQVAGTTWPPTRVAQLCQRAEHRFAGVACGIMDQYVAMHGRPAAALMLDCRSLTHEVVPLPDNLRLVVCDTLVRHAHAAGEYNRRRSECREAIHALAARWPHIASLRDVAITMLPDVRDLLDDTRYRRVKHVVTENARVVATAEALSSGNLGAVAELLPASHESLKTDYQVSSPELDALVQAALDQPGVYGARMTGGGFGGCAIALVERDAVDEFRTGTTAAYERATGRRTDIHVASAAEGAGLVDV